MNIDIAFTFLISLPFIIFILAVYVSFSNLNDIEKAPEYIIEKSGAVFTVKEKKIIWPVVMMYESVDYFLSINECRDYVKKIKKQGGRIHKVEE